MGLKTKYRERYKGHKILCEDILNEKKEALFFKELRERVREVRKELEITQREFGESAEIDRRYVAKVECGSQNPSFKFLRSISIRHKISMDWLLYGIGERYVKFDEDVYGKELQLFKKLLDVAPAEDVEVIMQMIKKFL